MTDEAQNDQSGQEVGKITHYFSKIGVGVIEITDGELGVGDTIRIQRGEEDFEQVITSMQVDHESVASAVKGQAIGLKVDQPVKEGDAVYRLDV